MSLVLTEDQEMLREAASGFLSEKSPISAFRKLRDDEVAQGFSPELWKEMAEMGWAGIAVPEAHGGSDFGLVGAGILAEEMGRHLVASPFLASAVMAATALTKVASDEQAAPYLSALAVGESLFAIAMDEGPKHRPDRTSLLAERSGNGFRLTGKKTFVADGHVADHLIVAARTAGQPGETEGITLFIIDASSESVSRSKTAMVDSRNAAEIDFNGVEVTSDAVIGSVDEGWDGLQKILNAGRAVVAAEMVGSADQAFGMTMDYIRERKQFGVPVGAFQALQHRAAHLYCELEICRAVVLDALQALDGEDDDAARKVSLAKAKVTQVALIAAQEGIQMHGGMGMTDAFDIGLYIKRIKVAGEMLGDASFHGEALARELGF